MEESDEIEDGPITDMEVAMNANELLRCQPVKYSNLDTELKVCKCGKRLIGFGFDVHMAEYHSGASWNEADYNTASQMALEAQL